MKHDFRKQLPIKFDSDSGLWKTKCPFCDHEAFVIESTGTIRKHQKSAGKWCEGVLKRYAFHKPNSDKGHELGQGERLEEPKQKLPSQPRTKRPVRPEIQELIKEIEAQKKDELDRKARTKNIFIQIVPGGAPESNRRKH